MIQKFQNWVYIQRKQIYYVEEISVPSKFTAASLIMTKTWKHPKCVCVCVCPCDCVCVYYSAIKKEENAAICVEMDGFWEHYAKWSKSDREREIRYDLIYVELKKKNMKRDEISGSHCQGEGAVSRGIEWRWSKGTKGTNFLL